MKGMKFWSVVLCVLGMLVAVACETGSNTEFPDASYFMKLYGRDGNQIGVDIEPLNDGGFLLLGSTQQNNDSRIFLVNVSAEGSVINETTLGGFSDQARDIESTLDGNFVILSVFQNGVENLDVKLIRIRPDGTKIDSVIYGSPNNDNARTVTPISDGGFIVTGETQFDEADFDPDAPAFNIFHYRFDGNLVADPNWDEYYGERGENDGATKAFEVGGSYYIFGHSSRPHGGKPSGNTKIHLQYYSVGIGGDADENITFLGEVNDDTRSVSVINAPTDLGGGFVILGTKTTSSGAVTLHISKIREPVVFDRTADELFDESISIEGRTLEAVAVAPTTVSSRGYLLLGNEVRSTGSRNIFLTKIDQSAIPEWSVSLGSEEEDDQGGNVLELSDGRIMVLGTVEIGDNQRKMVLFKLNSEGRLQE